MRKLVWDSELEASAQEEAFKCPGDYLPRYGVNIYAAPSREPTIKATKSWEWEFQYYGWNSTRMDQNIGLTPMRHAVQMVWAETSLIGCGINYCESFFGGDYGTTIVCHYKEKGNTQNADIYKQGETCSACSEGFKCETDSGLCAPVS
ncbi:unnamed protein product [Caenorhabditis nigoni]